MPERLVHMPKGICFRLALERYFAPPPNDNQSNGAFVGDFVRTFHLSWLPLLSALSPATLAQITDLGTLGGSNSIAWGVSADGAVVVCQHGG